MRANQQAIPANPTRNDQGDFYENIETRPNTSEV